jgi:hypothetical protein
MSGCQSRQCLHQSCRFLDSPRQTGRATFIAPGFPRSGIPRPALPPGPYPVSVHPSTLPTFREVQVSIYSGSPFLCLPSPCGRLSRPPTTMKAPTPLRFPRPTAGLCSQEQSPTFTRMDSAKEFRRRLSKQPNRSLRLPIRKRDSPGRPFLPLDWNMAMSSLGGSRELIPRNPDRCPIRAS